MRTLRIRRKQMNWTGDAPRGGTRYVNTAEDYTERSKRLIPPETKTLSVLKSTPVPNTGSVQFRHAYTAAWLSLEETLPNC